MDTLDVFFLFKDIPDEKQIHNIFTMNIYQH